MSDNDINKEIDDELTPTNPSEDNEDTENNEDEKELTLLDTLKVVLKARNLDDFDDIFLQIEINRAIAEINRCRRFTPKEDVLYDPKYEHLIIPMCVYALAKIGAEGQLTHSENGISRKYGTSGDYPTDLLKQIIPLIK